MCSKCAWRVWGNRLGHYQQRARNDFLRRWYKVQNRFICSTKLVKSQESGFTKSWLIFCAILHLDKTPQNVLKWRAAHVRRGLIFHYTTVPAICQAKKCSADRTKINPEICAFCLLYSIGGYGIIIVSRGRGSKPSGTLPNKKKVGKTS